jgi:hypothetical protein
MAAQKNRESAIGNKRDFYELADRVRTYYILEHRRYVEAQGGGPCTYGMRPLPRWDGGVDADGRVYERPIWLDIVSYALTNKVNPIVLVRGTFLAWNSPKPPDPNQFANPLGLRRALLITDPPTVLLHNLKMQDYLFKGATTVHQVYHHMDAEAAAQRALHNPTAGFTPLYRYCVGKLIGADDVVKRFRREAFQIYVFDRDAFDASWGDRIPLELRAAADRFYDTVLRCL